MSGKKETSEKKKRRRLNINLNHCQVHTSPTQPTARVCRMTNSDLQYPIVWKVAGMVKWKVQKRESAGAGKGCDVLWTDNNSGLREVGSGSCCHVLSLTSY